MKGIIANLFVGLCITALLFQTAHSQRAYLQYKKANRQEQTNAYTSVYVMMPLDVINNDGQVKDPQGLYYKLQKIRDTGADGIMIDVWWGIVERNGPRKYDWEGYRQIFKICADLNLKIQAVMSFHKCGTNVGDACYIELPKFVRNVGISNRDIYYTDRSGYRDEEYLTSGVNDVSIFPTADYSSAPNRTAVQMYSDFMRSFAYNFSSILGRNKQIVEIEVGLGPAGELRYPSYQLQEGRWSFPGVGEFQCYDKYLLSQLRQAANSAGHPEWGSGGPSNAGNYNSRPYDTGFFSGGFDNYASPYGRFFLDWYSRTLIQHGDRVLSEAVNIFNQYGASVAGKVAGIHWWYFDNSHAAELTAGYYNTNQKDAYADIARMFQKNGAEFLFTCLEMKNADQHDCQCGPEDLVRQTRVAANNVGVGYSGENALPSYNEYQYSQIINQASFGGRAMNAFTYLRLDDTLLRDDNLGAFKYFVQRMHNL